MKRTQKLILTYSIIIIACVVMLMVSVSQSQKREQETEAVNTELERLQNMLGDLQEENEQLKTENQALKENAGGKITLESDILTSSQALSDLKDIYEDFKSGNEEKAREAFSKIEPMGYDDATKAYYEILKDFLEK